ncbi:MAG: sulfotransferase domain-containing protein [Candidatus Hydrogenedentales bacterium]|jgi:hypothetical protein
MLNTTVIVSGLPRSGTSMMMAMLGKGRISLLTDDQRPADRFNPGGYYEYEPVKRLRESQDWLPLAKGRAVKIISFLLPALPLTLPCHIIFMERSLEAILASQRNMLGQGDSALNASLAADGALHKEDLPLLTLYPKHLDSIRRLLRSRAQTHCLFLHYEAILRDPLEAAQRTAFFLDLPMDTQAMASIVNRSATPEAVAAQP